MTIEIEILKMQRKTVQTRLSDTQRTLPERIAAVAEADAAVDNALRAELRGTAGPGEIDAAHRAREAAQARLEDARRMVRLASDEARRIDTEIVAAELAVQRERAAAAARLAGEIEGRLRGDKKLRAALVEIYGTWAASAGVGDSVNWTGILEDCFPQPSGDEAARAIAAAAKRLPA